MHPVPPKSPTMWLRDYAEDDASPTREVFGRAVHITAAADYSPQQRDAWAPESFDLAAWHVARSRPHTVVAVTGPRVVAFSDIDGTGLIDMLYVDPDVSGCGVASMLMARILIQARTSGLDRLTTYASLTARPFFERRGFTVLQRQCPLRGGIRLANFMMTRDLTATTTVPH